MRDEPRPRREPSATRPDGVPWLWSAALALAVLAADLLLAPHAVADGDAGELTLVLVTGGVAHPTGYPLFTLAGHLFVSLLRGAGVGYAFAANAWGALGAAVAAFFLHRLALRMLASSRRFGRGTRIALAALPVLVLSVQPQWLEESTVLEVYSWHVAWLCGTALLFVHIVQELAAARRSFPLAPRMLAWGFACGAGVAHHMTSVFFIAAYSAGLAWGLARAGRLRPWIPLAWAGAALVPLTSYAYLMLRAAHPGAATVWPALEPSWHGLTEHVSGAVYHGFLGRWSPDPDQAAELAHGVYPFLWPALALSAAWLVAAGSAPDRIARGALLGGSALQLAFAYLYGVPDPVSYFMAPLATSLPALADLSLAALGSRPAPARRMSLAAAAVVLLAFLAVWGTRSALARDREVVHYDTVIRSMWQAVPDQRSIFLWASDSYAKVRIYQRLEGDKPEVDVYDTAMLCKPRPEEQFRRRYGFDPLANNGPEHAGDTIAPKYFSESHRILGDRFLARVNQTIADSARVPVLLFNGSLMKLRRLNGASAAGRAALSGAR